jgi:hypothetical protein
VQKTLTTLRGVCPKQFNDVRTLECIVALDRGQRALRIGQRVRVSINE